MSSTHTVTTITLGDDPPQVRTYEARPPQPAFAVIALGRASVYFHTEDQAYALIGAFREAARFFEDADPDDPQTTTEAEADFQAQQARAELALPGKVAL